MAIDVNALIAVTVASGQPDETPRRTPDQLLPSGRTTVMKLDELATLIGVGGGSAGTFIQIEDQKDNQSGGTFTSGARRRRDLNTIVRDDTGGVSLDTNKFTLPEGEYKILARVPGSRVAGHVAVLVRDPSGSPSDVFAAPGEASSSDGATQQTIANIAGFFSVGSGGEEFAIEHQCQTTSVTNGFGTFTFIFGIDNNLCRFVVIELEKIV